MLLNDKTAIIYGAAGGIGRGVSRAFAAEGATVFLAGRTKETLDALAEDIRKDGGTAETAVVDALDPNAVDAHADAVAAQAGRIDISWNLIAHGYHFGTPMVDMALEQFEEPVVTALRSNFLTTKAAARHMIRQGSGVFLFFGGSGHPVKGEYLGGTQVAFETLEAMRQQLAAELGPHGIRTVTLRTGGITDTFEGDYEGKDEIVQGIANQTFLGRGGTLEDVCHAATFAASDRARAMTGATINISAGALLD
jgi:3-oxoacyl-[acyl-carrier protein] reductase